MYIQSDIGRIIYNAYQEMDCTKEDICTYCGLPMEVVDKALTELNFSMRIDKFQLLCKFLEVNFSDLPIHGDKDSLSIFRKTSIESMLHMWSDVKRLCNDTPGDSFYRTGMRLSDDLERTIKTLKRFIRELQNARKKHEREESKRKNWNGEASQA